MIFKFVLEANTWYIEEEVKIRRKKEEKSSPCRLLYSFYHPWSYSTVIYHHILNSFSSDLQPSSIYYWKYFEKQKQENLTWGLSYEDMQLAFSFSAFSTKLQRARNGWSGAQHVLQIMRKQKESKSNEQKFYFMQRENSTVKCVLNYNVKKKLIQVVRKPGAAR